MLRHLQNHSVLKPANHVLNPAWSSHVQAASAHQAFLVPVDFDGLAYDMCADHEALYGSLASVAVSPGHVRLLWIQT